MAEIKEITTPLYQRVGSELYKINLETTAAQVITTDGTNVQTRLDALEAGLSGSGVLVVADIAARDALPDKKSGLDVWVRDATADPTVDAGAARYLYDGAAWIKTAETESMDLVLDWALIQNKPSSTVADIDDAVAKRHEHANKTDVLDKLSKDADGNLLFDGARIDDGMVDVAFTDDIASIPANLRDGGLLLVKTPEAGA